MRHSEVIWFTREVDGPDRKLQVSVHLHHGGGPMGGVEVGLQGLSTSFGAANIWSDVTLTLPAGEIRVLRGPPGTGPRALRHHRDPLTPRRPRRGPVTGSR